MLNNGKAPIVGRTVPSELPGRLPVPLPVSRLSRPLRTALLASLLLAPAAHAQMSPRSEALPVVDKASGRVEAVLLLEPLHGKAWQFGNTTIDTGLGLGTGSRLGLVCDRTAGLASAIGNLVDNCLVASFAGPRDARQASAGASVSRPSGRVGVSVASSRETLPSWLTPAGRAGSRVDGNTLTLKGERNLGREATVSIGGTLARARLVSPDAVPSVSDRWDVRTVSVGANVGRFGANVVGRVVDSPASSDRWRGLGLGLTWRTPWSGELSVGADNVVTRGRNPFAPNAANGKDGTVPYVRYQQDL